MSGWRCTICGKDRTDEEKDCPHPRLQSVHDRWRVCDSRGCLAHVSFRVFDERGLWVKEFCEGHGRTAGVRLLKELLEKQAMLGGGE